MNTRIYALIIMILFLAAFAGCSSDKEKMDDVCTKLKAASQMTDDCSAMAKKLEPLTQKFETLLANLNQNVPDEKERALYIDSVSQCLSAYTEISTGSCGQDDAVKKAMPRMN